MIIKEKTLEQIDVTCDKTSIIFEGCAFTLNCIEEYGTKVDVEVTWDDLRRANVGDSWETPCFNCKSGAAATVLLKTERGVLIRIDECAYNSNWSPKELNWFEFA